MGKELYQLNNTVSNGVTLNPYVFKDSKNHIENEYDVLNHVRIRKDAVPVPHRKGGLPVTDQQAQQILKGQYQQARVSGAFKGQNRDEMLVELSKHYKLNPVDLQKVRDSFSLVDGIDKIAFIISSTGALIAITATICVIIAPESAPAVLSAIVSSKAFDGALLTTGLWITGRMMPEAMDAAERILTGDYDDKLHDPTQDVLHVLLTAVSTVFTATHINSYGLAAKKFAEARPALLELGYSSGEATRYALRQADHIRRLARDTSQLSQLAAIEDLPLAVTTFYHYAGPAADFILKWSPLVDAAYVSKMSAQFFENSDQQPLTAESFGQMSMAYLGFLMGQSQLFGPAFTRKLYKQSREGEITRPAFTEELKPDVVLREARKEAAYVTEKETVLADAQTRLQNHKEEITQNPAATRTARAKQILDYYKHAARVRRQEYRVGQMQSKVMKRLRKAYPQLPADKSQSTASRPELTLPSREDYRANIKRRIEDYAESVAASEKALQQGELKTAPQIARRHHGIVEETGIRPRFKREEPTRATAASHLLEQEGFSSFEAFKKSNPQRLKEILVDFSVEDFRYAFGTKDSQGNPLLKPSTVLRLLMDDPDWKDPSIFTRGQSNRENGRLMARALESDRRWAQGRPLRDPNGEVWDGLLFGLKDLYVSGDGHTTLSSTGAGINGKPSHLAAKAEEMGLLVIPISNVTGGMGGDGRNVRGRYLFNPSPKAEQTVVVAGERYIGTDLGGSSTTTTYVLKKHPIALANGTDTGGSSKVPPSVVSKVAAIIPGQDATSRTGMVPFHPGLDHTAFMSKHEGQAAIDFAKAISGEWNFTPSQERPLIAYIKEEVDASPIEARSTFMHQMKALEDDGYQVVALEGPEYKRIFGEIQADLFAPYAFAGSATAAMNPNQASRFGEPPRYGVLGDKNFGSDRFAKVEATFDLYPQVNNLIERNRQMVRTILGPNTVLATTVPQRVPSAMILGKGPTYDLSQHNPKKFPVILDANTGRMLDEHDWRTMISNFNPELYTYVHAAKGAHDIGTRVMYMGDSAPLVHVLMDQGYVHQSVSPGLLFSQQERMRGQHATL